MRILFTGASSFTGHWFVRALAKAGHEVTAVFRRPAEQYPDALRRRRVAELGEVCRPVVGVSFGDEGFMALLRDQRFDLLCHHAAEVTDYKSPQFNVHAALESNTCNLPAALEALAAGGCGCVLLTGSVFENDEGAGSEGLEAFSPYGLSKGLTYQVFRYHAKVRGLTLGKFVIPNPFGPVEEPRFTQYLVKTWAGGQTPSVKTPDYVRDNIHVSLLARCYALFAASLKPGQGLRRLAPSGYVESQGAFARRFAQEMSRRWQREWCVALLPQTEFNEPRVRINTDIPDHVALGWDEAAAWNELADYYSRMYPSVAAPRGAGS